MDFTYDNCTEKKPAHLFFEFLIFSSIVPSPEFPLRKASDEGPRYWPAISLPTPYSKEGVSDMHVMITKKRDKLDGSKCDAITFWFGFQYLEWKIVREFCVKFLEDGRPITRIIYFLENTDTYKMYYGESKADNLNEINISELFEFSPFLGHKLRDYLDDDFEDGVRGLTPVNSAIFNRLMMEIDNPFKYSSVNSKQEYLDLVKNNIKGNNELGKYMRTVVKRTFVNDWRLEFVD